MTGGSHAARTGSGSTSEHRWVPLADPVPDPTPDLTEPGRTALEARWPPRSPPCAAACAAAASAAYRPCCRRRAPGRKASCAGAGRLPDAFLVARRRSRSPIAGRCPPATPDYDVRNWLMPDEQRALVEDFRDLVAPPAGLRQPRVPSGHLMSVQSVCLGWHWQPYAYSRTRTTPTALR